MNKQSYFINNKSNKFIGFIELNVSLPPGIHNLFDLNNQISYEQIDNAIKFGTLRAAIDNNLCYIVANPLNTHSLSSEIIIRDPLKIQVLFSRARFSTVQNCTETVFDSTEDENLFDDESIKPARELEVELTMSIDNNEKVEATIKQANLSEKPIQNRYAPGVVRAEMEEQKIKNDIRLGYETCAGVTAAGKLCTRPANKKKRYCGLHKHQDRKEK